MSSSTATASYTSYGGGTTASTGWNTGGIISGTSTAFTDCSDYVSISPIKHLQLGNGAKIVKVDDGCEIEMPDGSILTIDSDGNFKVNDKNSKITYQANPIREFNRYINASDLLEEFIRFLGKDFDIRQNQIMDVPIQVFIEWLIVQAAMKDGDDYSKDQLKLDAGVRKEKNWYRRCRNCGRFIQAKLFDAGMNFCNTICVDQYQLKLG